MNKKLARRLKILKNDTKIKLFDTYMRGLV